jgi:hypothetical protein
MAREELEDLAEPEGFRPFGEEAKKRFPWLLSKVNEKRLRVCACFSAETGLLLNQTPTEKGRFGQRLSVGPPCSVFGGSTVLRTYLKLMYVV